MLGIYPLNLGTNVPYTTVTNAESIALHDKLVATSNVCEFVTVPGGTHGFQSQLPEWKDKVRTIVKKFLTEQGILPVAH